MFQKFKNFTGPASFHFKDPDTGLTYQEKSKEDLILRINSYRSQNKLEKIELLSFVLENYWCSLRENIGKCVPVQTKRGILGYIKGGIALAKAVMYSKFCTLAEASRRADICIKCPHNVIPTNATWLNQKIYHMIGDDKKTPVDEYLGECEICSCPLKAKVHIGEEIILDKDTENKLPDYCWQKKGN